MATAKELASIAKARAAAKADHPKGSQTPKQLAAERANLVKARAALKIKESLKPKKPHKASTAKLAREQLYGGYPSSMKRTRLLGSRFVSDVAAHRLKVTHPTGINHKFKRRISPESFDQRTSWKSARTHHYKRRLRARKSRGIRVSHWRKRKGRLTPR